MNNAVASKDQLGLSVGVSLSSQQVAALTHDIVWLEEHEVNGEKVLVPVLYLAQANNRLGPTGALLAGNDVTVIAGENLENVGTIRATNNLSVTAGNDVVNSGLLEAGNRLDLLAGNDVVNKSGGIIAGRDVSVMAVGGDVINERSVTSAKYTGRYAVGGTDYADSAASIEAANDMRISAGRDVSVIGGVLQSGRDTSIDAGRDVNLLSTSTVVSDSYNTTVTQLGADVASGRDLKINAARDVNAIASQISAKRDIGASAGEDLTISSAADEYHYFSQSKKVTVQKDNIRQVATDMEAGGNISLVAGQDLAVTSSRITAANEAYLVAGDNLDILAAQDSDYSLYDKKKKGSWGKKQTKHDEVTDIRHVGSEITTGGNLTLASGGDQHYQVASLSSGNDLLINSGGAVTFEGVKDYHDESHIKSKNSAAWFSSKGKGRTDETLRQSELTATGKVVIQAVNGLQIDVKQVNQESVSQSIDAMVKADPQLTWLKDAEQRGDVDWRQVKEIHESFKYANSGLGPAAQIVVAILMAAVLGPAGLGLSGANLAVLTTVATTATNSAISNKGDLGAVFKDVTSSDAMKGYVVSGLMAGVVPAIDPATVHFDLNGLVTVSGHVVSEAAVKTAIMGGSLKDNLGAAALGSVVSIGGAKVAGKIGDFTMFEGGKVTKVAMHAALGGLMAEAMGGDFRSGALAAGANEMVVEYLAEKLLPAGVDRDSDAYQKGVSKLLTASELIGALTAAAAGGDASIGAEIAANGTRYNYLAHEQLVKAAKELNGCRPEDCRAIAEKYVELSRDQTIDAVTSCLANVSQCAPASKEVANTAANLDQIYGSLDDNSKAARESLQLLINENMEFQPILAMATAGATANAMADAVQAKFNLTPEETHAVAQVIAGGLGAAPGGAAAFRSVLKTASARGKNGAQGLADGDATGKPAPVLPDDIGKAAVGGKTCVYSCVIDGVTRYVGITDDILKRGQAHLRQKGITIDDIAGLQNLSREDARAVEQTLINYHGLGKDGGTLINKINSISATRQPTKYEQALIRGSQLLKNAEYEGF